MTEKHLPPLELNGLASQVADRCRKWKRAFEYYAEGKSIDNVRKESSQLLQFAKMEVQDIFEDLQDSGPVLEEGDNGYKAGFPLSRRGECSLRAPCFSSAITVREGSS